MLDKKLKELIVKADEDLTILSHKCFWILMPRWIRSERGLTERRLIDIVINKFIPEYRD